MLQSHRGRILITAGVAGDPSSVRQWRGAHPGGGARYWGGQESLRGEGGGGSTAVENYTTSINHLYPTVFLSPWPPPPTPTHTPHPISITCSPSSSSLSWLCISLPSLCDPTAPRPDRCPLDFCPLSCLLSLHRGLYWSTTGHRQRPALPPASFPPWFVYMLSLLIGPTFVACQGFIPCPRDCISNPWDWLVSLRASRYRLFLNWGESFSFHFISSQFPVLLFEFPGEIPVMLLYPY